MKLLESGRIDLPDRNVITLKEMDAEESLLPLFISLCPAAKKAKEEGNDAYIQTVRKIISAVHNHTLTVTLSALTLSVSGLSPEELLDELNKCGINPPSGESVELYKDGTYSDGLMREQLEILGNIIHTYEPPGTYDEGKYYYYCSALALRTGDAASSEKFLLEAERIVSCAVGPTHPETLLLRRELMHFYQSQGKFQKALVWQKKTMSIEANT